jgi:hypothetical protein
MSLAPEIDDETVVPALHNRTMGRFTIFRRALVGEESALGGRVTEPAREQAPSREVDGETSSKLGALIVLLAPLAAAAWVAIGLSVYRLLT